MRGEIPELKTEEERKDELERKKKVYASMGLLVALPKDGVVIAGLLTDESGATQVTLRQNTIIGGGGGVWLCEYARGFVKENTISELNEAAIIVESGSDPEVTANTIFECGECGIHVKEGGKGRITSNTIKDNAGGGIILEKDSSSDLRANVIRDNDAFGVQLLAGCNGRLSGNTIKGIDGDGVLVEGECTAQLRNNEISESTGCGIHIVTARSLVIEENDVHHNEASGVRLSAGVPYTPCDEGGHTRSGRRSPRRARAAQTRHCHLSV